LATVVLQVAAQCAKIDTNRCVLQAGDVLQLVWGTELPVAVAGQLMSHLHTISPPQHVLQLWLLFLIGQAPVSVAQLVRLQPAVAAAAAGCSCKVRHACMQQLCRALACADPGASAPHAAAAVQVLLLYGGLSTDSLGTLLVRLLCCWMWCHCYCCHVHQQWMQPWCCCTERWWLCRPQELQQLMKGMAAASSAAGS